MRNGFGRRCLLAIACATAVTPVCPAAEDSELYVRKLNDNGFGDIAIDYLNRRLSKSSLTSEEKSDIEFEIASSLISVSEALGDLSKKEDKMVEARNKFDEWLKKYPKADPAKKADGLTQIALIDLQQGRLRTIQAQMPANAKVALTMGTEARKLFDKSALAYGDAEKKFKSEYDKMPVFIPEDEREQHEKKSKLFSRYIEARFQALLCKFFAADSYRTIEVAKPANEKDAAAMAAYNKDIKENEMRYKNGLKEAYKGFEGIYNDHRRELVGLYGHLWMARCLSAQGEYRRALGIYEQLLAHDNEALRRFQRQVAYFRFITFMQQKEYMQVIANAEQWLKENLKFSREDSYLGTQFEMAQAYIIIATAPDAQEATKMKYLLEADRLLMRLVSTNNSYQGLASREQIKLLPLLNKDIKNKNFSQLYAAATTKLDTLKPDTPPDERQKAYDEILMLLKNAIRLASPEDDQNMLIDAKVTLAYVYLLADYIYEGAVLSDYMARNYPKSQSAKTAASLGVQAYAIAYDNAMTRKTKANLPTQPESDAAHLVSFVEYVLSKWGDSKEGDDARVILGNLEYSRGNYEKATAAFDAVGPKSPKYAVSLATSGSSYWDWYKVASRSENPEKKLLDDLVAKAMDRLSKASKPLHDMKNNKLDFQLFVNDAMLGEVYFEASEDEKALAVINPLVEAIEKGGLPSDITPQIRTNVLITALQCNIRKSQLDQTDRLVDLISKQEAGGGEQSNVTLVFIRLASRLKEQIERLKAQKDDAKLAQMTEAFERFLDKIAGRPDQPIEALAFISNNYVELGKHDKAIGLLEKVITHPQAADEAKKGTVLKAQLFLVRCKKEMKQFDGPEGAIAKVDELFKKNAQNLEIMMERGHVLDAAGLNDKAIVHWKFLIKKMQPNKPKPDEYYQSLDLLIVDFLKAPAAEKPKRMAEGNRFVNFLLNADAELPPQWRLKFTEHSKAIQKELGGGGGQANAGT